MCFLISILLFSSVASDLGLHCLHRTQKREAGLIWVKFDNIFPIISVREKCFKGN